MPGDPRIDDSSLQSTWSIGEDDDRSFRRQLGPLGFDIEWDRRVGWKGSLGHGARFYGRDRDGGVSGKISRMRAVIQRVSEAGVAVGDDLAGAIGPGLLVLVGVTHLDDSRDAEALARKIVGLRIFRDGDGLMNLSVREIGGAVLLVSQFTLYADVRRGRRPSFVEAAAPEQAEPLFDLVVDHVAAAGVPVATGRFGAKMDVWLSNDGPVTVIIETQDGVVV